MNGWSQAVAEIGMFALMDATLRPAARISMSGARAAYVGPALDLAPHRNAAATLAVALERPFMLALGGAAPVERGIALIPPGTRHHLRARGPMAFVYLDALADDLAALAALDLEAARRRLLRQPDAGVDALCGLLGVPARAAPDPRIGAIAAAMEWQPDRYARAADAAAAAGLSPSRFQALFREGLGVPFRRWRLWRRMALAVRLLAEGRNLTAAAHEAGFASSAHLSTAFRGMFGIAPSALVAMGAQISG